MGKRKILFLNDEKNAWGLVADGFAKKIVSGDLEIYSSGAPVSNEVMSIAVKAMEKFDIDISNLSVAKPSEIGSQEFDLVVTFSERMDRQNNCYRGMPPVVNWNLKAPDLSILSTSEKETEYLKQAEKIKQLVDNLFHNGFFTAFSRKKINTDNIINSLSEGLLAHDLDRKIFYFSDQAVKLTGLRREAVIGKDCHEVFIGGICGENCSFCNKFASNTFAPTTYPVSFVNETGQKKQCDLSVMPLKDEFNDVYGIVASFKDNSEMNLLKMRNKDIQSFMGIIGNDDSMLEIYQQIRDVADYDFPVHIFGETGTGKELVAAAIHNESPRKNKAFVPVNCGALPETLIESELFGHVRGAFTGAVKDKKGRFELAEGGTIFLDEIGELSKDIQVKLLRFLQEGTFEKVGGEKTMTADVRVISATNRELKKEIASGNFREDFYYRLNVIPVNLPALREKKNDIPILVSHFCVSIEARMNKKIPDFSRQAISKMMLYSWPGNVRELENAVQYSIVRSRGKTITAEHLPMELGNRVVVQDIYSGPVKKAPAQKLNEESVRAALKEAGGNKSKAAKLLGVGRATLYRFLG